MDLTISVTQRADSTLVIQDITDYPNNYNFANIENVIITILHTPPYESDNIYPEGATPTPDIIVWDITYGSGVDSQDDLIFNVLPQDIVESWTVIPDGVYYIKYEMTDNTGVHVNTTTNYGEVLFSQIQQYHDRLFLKLSRDILSAKQDSDFYKFAEMFNLKFIAMLCSINVGNVPQIHNTMDVLEAYMNKYPNPNFNDTDRFNYM